MASLTDYGQRRVTNLRNFSETLALEDLWKDKPCAIFFLRRLGCSICRSYIRMIESYRQKYEKRGARLVCMSFESFGEGSDTDRSFQGGGFWNGPIFKISKDVYEELFGRKKLLDNFFGLLDIDKEAYARAKGTPGNLKGDGFQLGGQFVVAQGGRIVLEHRQKVFGDDAKPADIFTALSGSLGLNPDSVD